MTEYTQAFELPYERTGRVLALSFELLASVEQADPVLIPDEVEVAAGHLRAFLDEHLEPVVLVKP